MGKSNTQRDDVGLQPGAKVGKYEVVERLGIGGQAIVYKCRDPLLDRYVAVKQVSSHLADDPELLRRFREEARTLAKLGAEQPAIVTIHELVEDERGLFIVMEYVEGHTLEATLRDNPGPVDPKATLRLLWRLAAALHSVHQAGIVHRDIKPANIIVTEGMHAKLMDFGVAASRAGQASVRMGTTKYMAPELFEGDTVDARADIYSLGFITYEMLLGREKFNEIFADVIRDPQSEVLRWMKWHGNRSVHAPPVHEVNPAVPRVLSDIVARMTELVMGGDARLGRVLEVGTGSGYQAAVLAQLCQSVFTVERIVDILEQARRRHRQLGLLNIRYMHRDGFKGWPSQAPYDGIVVTAAPDAVPSELKEQLAIGGRMVIPVGAQGGGQKLTVITRLARNEYQTRWYD
ncbi:MAG: protein kinase domain-containing protein, partial [Planctomycetota bacterium]